LLISFGTYIGGSGSLHILLVKQMVWFWDQQQLTSLLDRGGVSIDI